jgi:hypothetical protein
MGIVIVADATTTRRAREYRRRAAKLANIASHARDAEDRRHCAQSRGDLLARRRSGADGIELGCVLIKQATRPCYPERRH